MNRLHHFLCLGLMATSALYPSIGFSQSSPEYAQMATAAWSAFECSSLASKAGNPAEQERLFFYGYNQGRSFISALQEQKIEQEDISREVPIIMLLLLQGPSDDFMLGRVYEAAQESALEGIYVQDNIHFNADEQKLNAENKFRRQNCGLIGK